MEVDPFEVEVAALPVLEEVGVGVEVGEEIDEDGSLPPAPFCLTLKFPLFTAQP